jgi:hypothetical protein
LQIRVQAIWAKQHFALDKRTIRVSVDRYGRRWV